MQGTEVKEGNAIRRQWKSELNSYPYAYTQVIVIEDEKDNERLETENKAEEIKALANDLNEHKGELGYPIPTLPVMQCLNAAYNEVFDANGDLQKEADKNKVERLRNTLKEISLIGDEDIVKPASRHYYTLRNFQDIYGRYAYFIWLQQQTRMITMALPEMIRKLLYGDAQRKRELVLSMMPTVVVSTWSRS